MDPLYLQDFGLSRNPFNVTPDPSFLYLSASHREALAQLEYGIKTRRGFILLTGEVGTGKTTLIHALLEELEGRAQTAYVFNTIINPRDLLRYVCEDFGIGGYDDDRREIHDYLIALNRFLLESYNKGDNVVLILDEAQNLSAEVLENVRLLSNFETARDKLIQILLVGQPELKTRLDLPQHRQLKQRIALRHHLGPLSFSESKEYVAKRIHTAGGNPSIFASDALERIFAYSQGVPRLINLLCDNALLGAYASGKKKIDAVLIREAAQDLDLIPAAHTSPYPANPYFLGAKKGQPLGAAGAESQPRLEAVSSFSSAGRPAMNAPAREARDSVSRLFFERMITTLAEAMGPMAGVVLRDRISRLGESFDFFPRRRLEELVDAISQEILYEPLRIRFQQSMLQDIHRIKAL